jgi:hypothetical protein
VPASRQARPSPAGRWPCRARDRVGYAHSIPTGRKTSTGQTACPQQPPSVSLCLTVSESPPPTDVSARLRCISASHHPRQPGGCRSAWPRPGHGPGRPPSRSPTCVPWHPADQPEPPLQPERNPPGSVEPGPAGPPGLPATGRQPRSEAHASQPRSRRFRLAIESVGSTRREQCTDLELGRYAVMSSDNHRADPSKLPVRLPVSLPGPSATPSP